MMDVFDIGSWSYISVYNIAWLISQQRLLPVALSCCSNWIKALLQPLLHANELWQPSTPAETLSFNVSLSLPLSLPFSLSHSPSFSYLTKQLQHSKSQLDRHYKHTHTHAHTQFDWLSGNMLCIQSSVSNDVDCPSRMWCLIVSLRAQYALCVLCVWNTMLTL